MQEDTQSAQIETQYRRIVVGVTLALAAVGVVIGLAVAGLSGTPSDIGWPLAGLPVGLFCVWLRRWLPHMRLVALLPHVAVPISFAVTLLALYYRVGYLEPIGIRALGLGAVATSVTIFPRGWAFGRGSSASQPSGVGGTALVSDVGSTSGTSSSWARAIRSIPGWSFHLALLALLCAAAARPVILEQFVFLLLFVLGLAATFMRVSGRSARLDLTPLFPAAAHRAALVILAILMLFLGLPLAVGSPWAYLGIGLWTVLSFFPVLARKP